MLLPPAFQDKTQFLPLGRKVEKPEPLKADPVAEFERVSHDTPGPCKATRAWVDAEKRRKAMDTLIALSDAEMAKARARAGAPAAEVALPEGWIRHEWHRDMTAVAGTDLKAGDVVTMACLPGKTYTIAELAETGSGRAVFAGITERKLDWPKLDEA